VMVDQCECLAAWVDNVRCICDDDKYRGLLNAIRYCEPVIRPCRDLVRAKINEVHIGDEDFDKLVRNPSVEPSYVNCYLALSKYDRDISFQFCGIKFIVEAG
jgi:hypothetical protein